MTEKQLKRLIKQYTKARDEIIKKILSVKSIGTKVYYNTVLKEINRIIKKLSKQTHEVIETEIPDIYRKALEELYGYFTKNNLTMLPPNAFAQIHEDAVYDLVKEAEYHTDDALARVGRQVQRYMDAAKDEALRQAGIKASAQKIATASTVTDMKNALEKELKGEGFMTVQYGSGKKAYQVPVETYVAMVARSTTREAGNIARENQLTANGYDLVQMTEHYPTCAVCSALQGRVFSISGKDTRFRPLSDAFSSGYRNVHPNCRHAIGPWIERGYSPEEVEAESQKSLAPLDDVRSSEERELYNKQQRQNREARQNYFQWKRYKERLGDDAPKSQLALERIKKKGGQEWEELQRKYRAAGVDKAGESGIISVGRSVGAAAKNYPVKLPDSNQHTKLAEGQSIAGKVFAGKTTGKELRDRFRLESTYHIPADEWMKVSGKGKVIKDGKEVLAELHWYEANNEKYEIKVKRYLDES